MKVVFSERRRMPRALEMRFFDGALIDGKAHGNFLAGKMLEAAQLKGLFQVARPLVDDTFFLLQENTVRRACGLSWAD